MPDIFLSYSREDQATARVFAEGFEREGFSVWWDASLNPGEAFDQVTEKALREAQAVVVLWSKKSVDSRWVRAEAMQANDNKTLVPVMIEPCKRPIMFELTHTADLSQWTGDRKDSTWQSFVAGVRLFVERGGPVAAASPAATTSRASESPVMRASRRGVESRSTKVALGFAILGMALLAVPAFQRLRETPQPETRVDIVTPATDQPESLALSPDGRQIVFAAYGEDGISRLWLRSLSATTAQPLAGTEDARLPFWSPDSRSVAFFANGELQRLDLGGGAPRPLAAAPVGLGGAWNAEGVIVFAPHPAEPLSRISATGGSAIASITLAAKQEARGYPVFLPDGRHFLFAAAGASPGTGDVYLAALGTTDVRRLTSAISRVAYLPSGWLLWVQPSGSLVAQRLDLAQQRLTGDPVTIAEGVTPGAFSVSATRLVAYRTGGGSARRQLMWFDRAGKPQGVLGDPDETLSLPSLSSDGKRTVVSRTVQGRGNIWLLDGTRTSRLTFDPTGAVFPVWSPDGRSIAFTSTRSGSGDLYRQAVDGSGAAVLLVASSQLKAPTDWSKDGRFLLYYSIDLQTKGDLWVRPMTGDQKPWVFLKTPFDEEYGQFSPDGQFVAYESDESGRYEIYIRPFTPPDETGKPAEGQWQVSTGGGLQPHWSPDGRELYYLDPAGRMMAVSITVTGATVTPGTPVLLFPTKISGGGGEPYLQYAVAHDGRFLINTVLDENRSTAPIRLILNWNPEVKP